MRVGINGFGRIGRLVLRAALARGARFDVVAVNDRGSAEINAHLFQFDSTYGPYRGRVELVPGALIVDGKPIAIAAHATPRAIPWRELGVDLVIEATGAFTSANAACDHLVAGARRVLITAPSKGADVTIVMGVNHDAYEPDRHCVISAASCTTNALAPLAKVLHEQFGIRRGMAATIHAATNDQTVLDRNHKDPRRARATAGNIIPTTTGAAKALDRVLPELKGRIQGIAYRVPTATVSLVDLVAELERPASADAINTALATAAIGELAGILGFSDLPLVSSDYRGDARSCIVDGLSTAVTPEQGLVRVVGWYDNEWGYANRVVDLVEWIDAADAQARATAGRSLDDRALARATFAR